MRLTAECVFIRDADGWTAEFPALGIATSVRTRDEALKGAREILELEAFDLLESGAPAPRLRHVAGVGVISVDVTAEDAERAHFVTKAQAAERLDVSKPRVTALIASGRLEVRQFGSQELVSLASIAEYAATPRAAGRPAATLIA